MTKLIDFIQENISCLQTVDYYYSVSYNKETEIFNAGELEEKNNVDEAFAYCHSCETVICEWSHKRQIINHIERNHREVLM